MTSYFGHPEWEQFAPGLKTLDDALLIRRKILCAFERAETASDPAKRDAAMSIVVIGGGPTGVELDHGGRVKVLPDLSVPGHPEVFALGDRVSLVDAKGVTVPGVAQGAMQTGAHAAKLVLRELDGEGFAPVGREPFAYYDKGSLATIGRSSAVGEIKGVKLRGFTAWAAWLGIHLFFILGFRNKVSVLVQWVYSYFTYKRGARVITDVAGGPPANSA